MSHIIHAIVLKGPYNHQEADKYELTGVDLNFDLTLFFIDNDFIDYWEKKLAYSGYLESNCHLVNKRVIYDLMKRISLSDPIEYAVIVTAYVGGMGDQFANIYRNDQNADLSVKTINEALNYLGTDQGNHLDEFDAVGLGRFRSNPAYLDKYQKLLGELE